MAEIHQLAQSAFYALAGALATVDMSALGGGMAGLMLGTAGGALAGRLAQCYQCALARGSDPDLATALAALRRSLARSEEHTSELQSLMRNSYAVFCLKKKKKTTTE